LRWCCKFSKNHPNKRSIANNFTELVSKFFKMFKVPYAYYVGCFGLSISFFKSTWNDPGTSFAELDTGGYHYVTSHGFSHSTKWRQRSGVPPWWINVLIQHVLGWFALLNFPITPEKKYFLVYKMLLNWDGQFCHCIVEILALCWAVSNSFKEHTSGWLTFVWLNFCTFT
jgi:hypothetical protein